MICVVGCSGGSPEDAVGASSEGVLADAAGNPLPCADPTFFSDQKPTPTTYFFCTGMRHVWTTTDWKSFEDAPKPLTFDFGNVPTVSRNTDAWWAPTVIYSRAESRFVLWVSVIDGQKSWHDETRSLAVFKSAFPLGPWKYEGLGHAANGDGQMIIDPMIFRDSNGDHYLYWKQYGGGLHSRLMGAQVNSALTGFSGNPVELLDGFDPSSWEGNCRENPAVWEDAANRTWHMLYSGAYWGGGSYATGHAVSDCGPLCTHAGRGWRIDASSNRGVPQVVEAKGDSNFKFGGPGGAVWNGSNGDWIVYAAAARSENGDHARYLMRDNLKWANGAPFVDTAGHRPTATSGL